MKIGDNVWVSVSRDRERSGKIEEINLTYNLPYLVSLDGLMANGSTRYSILDVRPASKPQTKPQSKSQAATKYDEEKNRLELIPPEAIEALGRAFTFGAAKYSDDNWRQGFAWRKLIGAALRHINAFNSGENKDKDSGNSHIDHALACLAMLSAHEAGGLGNDDRSKTKD